MNNMQVWIFLAVVAVTVVQAVWRKVQEQREIKRIRDAQLRQQEDMLRRGVPVEEAAPTIIEPAQPTPEYLAQQERRRQAAELLAQNQARQEFEQQQRRASYQQAPQPQPQPASSEPIVRELWPGGPVVVIQAGGAPTLQSAPQPQPAAQEQARPQIDEDELRSEREERRRKRKAAAELRAAETAELKREASPRRAQPSERPSRERAAPAGSNKWREAFIMSELIQPPVGLRESHL